MKFREIQLRDSVSTANEIHNYFTEGHGLSDETKVVSLTDTIGTTGVGVVVVFENGDQWLIPWSNITGAERKFPGSGA